MVRKLNLIIIMFISMLLIPLPLYARSGRGGFGGGRGGGFGGFGGGGGRLGGNTVIRPGGPSYYPTSGFTPAAKLHGILQIKVITEDAEIYVDGRFIGLARDFKGPAIVSVPSGNHTLEFRYNGSSHPTNVYVARDRATSVVYSFDTYETK